MAKKIHEGIDTSAILDSIRPDTPPIKPSTPVESEAVKDVAVDSPPEEVVSAPTPKEVRTTPKRRATSRRKKDDDISDFEKRFIHKADIPARLGKLVYLRTDYHEKISKIIRVIGKDNITIFDYIDNVLTEHFEKHDADISLLYNLKDEGYF